MRTLFLLIVFVSTVFAQITVRFSDNSDAFSIGPFPSNALKATDLSGTHVTLPEAENDCKSEQGPVCGSRTILNQMDGFSIHPRLMVCFSGDPVDATSLAQGITITPIHGADEPAMPVKDISIDQVIVDAKTNCAFAKPAEVLDQQSQYLLVITSTVHDTSGNAVQPDPEFSSCLSAASTDYCAGLAKAIGQASVPKKDIAGASLFTTLTATGWLEQARQFVDALPSINLPAGPLSKFSMANVKSITWNMDVNGNGINTVQKDIAISALVPDVAGIAFGLFPSANYVDPFSVNPGTIDSPPTLPISVALVSYHVFLPANSSNQSSTGKIPVVIYGHGMGDSQFGAPTYMARTLAKNGYATLALEVTGHGYGPFSSVTVKDRFGIPWPVATPGRGIKLQENGVIPATAGCIAPGPFGIRDCARQTAVDLFTLVHLIQANGLGLNLDPQRIYYVGQSLGASYGTLFMAVEPGVKTAVLNGAGGSSVDTARLAITGRPLATAYLASLGDPLLLNVDAGIAAPEAYFRNVPVPGDNSFNDNFLFPNTAPVVNYDLLPSEVCPVAADPSIKITCVAGSMADQAAFEAAEWIGMTGDPLAFAPHLQTSPLPGVPAKKALFQFGIGDLEVPNPTESAVVLAANAVSSTSLFNFPAAVALRPELAVVQDPAFPGLLILPHRVLSNPTIFSPGNEAEASVALAEQAQTADFFNSDGKTVTNPDAYLGAPFSPADDLFVVGPKQLPTLLNFVQIPQ